MNFHNAAFDGTRGVPGDAAYKEYIIGSDFTVARNLAVVFRDALQLVRGKTYTAKQSFNLYPTGRGQRRLRIRAAHRRSQQGEALLLRDRMGDGVPARLRPDARDGQRRDRPPHRLSSGAAV